MNESEIFANILKLATPAEQRAYLDEVCASDPQLRAAVEALLKAHATDPGFLEQPAESLLGTSAQLPGASASKPASAHQVGRPGVVLAGRYKLIEPIGEGGMGAVWMAQQTEPVKRLVAVKLIKDGMDSGQIIARFEAERQALALMDHPNIARVLDAGTAPDGRPYFVMELVKGVPITRYCDEHRLTPRQRLELFIPVCQAIQHAHQKGVIHRDIKPSNVLVALYDDQPVPKVIDFGVAKATGQQLTERTLNTGFGAVVGTIEYMSPEQAGFNQLDIDTRSDVYSLGVLLYELLAGSPPFSRKHLEKVGVLEMLRVIREEEPSKPSTKLRSSGALPALSSNRGMEPDNLTRQVRGELDWIVMKALEKDRGRRYDTPNGFAMDLQRYLTDEPVLACPPSLGYRLRKFARRNKALISTVGLVAAALLIGIAVSVWQALRATDAEREMATQRDAATLAEGRATENAQRADTQRGIAVQNEQAARTNELLARRRYYAAQMNLAMQAWEEGNSARVLEILETQRPRFDEEDMRGFEWYHLWHQCHRGCRAVLRTGSVVQGMAFAPDGRTLALVHENGAISLWDPDSRPARLTVLQMRDPVTRLAYSPGGDTLALVSRARVSLRDAKRGTDLGEIAGKTTISCLAFFPDGKTLATGHADDTVTLWDMDQRKERTTIKLTNPPRGLAGVRAVAIALDGKILAFSRGWGVIVGRWDGSAWRELHRHLDVTHYVHHLSFSRDGKTLAAASPAAGLNRSHIDDVRPANVGAMLPAEEADPGRQPQPAGGQVVGTDTRRGVRIWDVETGQDRMVLKGRGATGWVGQVAFAPDGKTLAVCNDRTALFYDPATGEPMASVHAAPAHRGAVLAMAFSADGKTLVTSGRDNIVKVWDRQTIPEASMVGGGALTFTPDGETLVTGTAATVKLWDPFTTREKETRRFGKGAIRIPLSADGGLVVTQGPEINLPRVWEFSSGRELLRLPPSSVLPYDYALSPDSRTLAIASEEMDINLWDIPSKRLRVRIPNPSQSFRIVYAPNGRFLATGSWDGKVRFFDPEKGVPLGVVQGGKTWVTSLAFSHDSRLLASGNRDGSLKVWDTTTRELRTTLRGHADAVTALAFFPDGQTLASGTEDGLLKLWDLTTGQERISLRGHRSAVAGLAVNRTSNLLAASSVDGTVRVYRSDRLPEAIGPRTELDPDDPESPLRQMEAGQQLWTAGKLVEAASAFARARTRLEKLAARFPDNLEYGRELALLASCQGLVPSKGGNQEERRLHASQLFRQLSLIEQRTLAHQLVAIGQSLEASARHDDAESAYTLAIELLPDNASLWFARAYAYSQTKQPEKSLRDYARVLELEPENTAAWNNRGVALDRLGQQKEALAHYVRAAELAPTEPLYWNNRARSHDAQREWEEAAAAFSRVIELKPTEARPRFDRGGVYTKLSRWEDVVADFTRVVELEPTNPAAWYNRGIGHENLRLWHLALIDYSKAVELSPKVAEYWFKRGLAHDRLRKHQEAVADYTRLIELQPKNAAAWNNRGVAWRGLGQLDRALEDYTEAAKLQPDSELSKQNRDGLKRAIETLGTLSAAIEADPKRADHRDKRVKLYVDLELWDKAAEDLAVLCELRPTDWLPRRNLAYTLARLGKDKEAAAEVARALELGKDEPRAWLSVGNIYRDLGRFEESIRHYDQAIVLQPQHPDAWHSRANVHYRLRQWEKSAADYTAAINRHTTLYKEEKLPPNLFNLRAHCYTFLGRHAEAGADCETAYRIAARKGAASNNLAWFLATCPDEKLRDPKRAVALAKEAVEAAPKSWLYWNTLGVAHYRAGDAKAAVAALEKAMELNQGGTVFDWLFLAMAHQQLGAKEAARRWHDRAAGWLHVNLDAFENDPSHDVEVGRFRGEAERLLGIASQPMDSRLWITRGRNLAECGLQQKADADFARAASLAPEEPHKFLEAGWWIVGPYPEDLKTPYPPEKDFDPSNRDAGRVPWQRAAPDEAGLVDLSNLLTDANAHTGYGLTYVYSPTERSALLLVAGDPLRVWLNDRLVHEMNQVNHSQVWRFLERVPVTLQAGRNVLLVKASGKEGMLSFRARLADYPLDQGSILAEAGAWKEASACFSRGIHGLSEKQLDQFWYCRALTHLLANDREAYRRLTESMRERYKAEPLSADVRAYLLAPDGADAPWLLKLAQRKHQSYPKDWNIVILGVAHLRAGEFKAARESLEKAYPTGWYVHWPALAITYHRLGQTDKAREWLQKVDQKFETTVQQALTRGLPKVSPDLYWEDWAYFEIFRREAKQLIEGRMVDENPALRAVFRGRAWAELGNYARAQADFDEAFHLKPDDVRLQISLGRYFASVGQHQRADANYIRAASRTSDDLNPFLQTSWWVAGPYPHHISVPCPPEQDPDPARTVAGFGNEALLKWQSVQPTVLETIDFRAAFRLPQRFSAYALNYVFSPEERTATLLVSGSRDVRVWLNGQLIHDAEPASRYSHRFVLAGLHRVPVTLRAGRNTLLVKANSETNSHYATVRIGDGPLDRATDLAEIGLWNEAADLLRKASASEREADHWTWLRTGHLLLASGDRAGYRDHCARMREKFRTSTWSGLEYNLARVCALSPDGVPEPLLLTDLATRGQEPTMASESWRRHVLGWAHYRAGNFQECIRILNEIKGFDPRNMTFLAMAHHRLGQTDEARRRLAESDKVYTQATQAALKKEGFHPFLWSWTWWDVLEFTVLLREARTLIEGAAPKDDPNLAALQARARAFLKALDPKTAAYDVGLALENDQPRLWLARGRRHAELKQWEKAVADCTRATELNADNAQAWKERGQTYAASKEWEKAVDDLARASALKPDDVEVWNERSRVATALGNDDQAAAFLARVQELEGAFVLLGSKGVERKFDTLGEAVEAAHDGATIEIRGQGPFVLRPMDLGVKNLTIRAAPGYTPVLQGGPVAEGEKAPLLSTDARLVLEGLHLQQRAGSPRGRSLIYVSDKGTLFLANCRLVISGSAAAVYGYRAPALTLRNCELLRKSEGYFNIGWTVPDKGQLAISNCVLSDYVSAQILNQPAREVRIDLKQSTICGNNAPLEIRLRNATILQETDEGIQISAVGNVLDGNQGDLVVNEWFDVDSVGASARARQVYPRLVRWTESENLHQARVWYGLKFKEVADLPPTKTLEEWNRFWKQDSKVAVVGRPKYAGGDIAAKVNSDWEKITAQDFRLAQGSPGHRAGKDGKDLGADMDLVGPGPAHERWKKTPDYQQWLKESGQVK